MNSSATSITTTTARRATSLNRNLRPSSSRCCMKPRSRKSTTSSGTSSGWTRIPTRRSISPNSYIFVYSGMLHPQPRWRDRTATIPQAATRRQGGPDRRGVLHRPQQRLLLPVEHAQGERCSGCHLQPHQGGKDADCYVCWLPQLGAPRPCCQVQKEVKLIHVSHIILFRFNNIYYWFIRIFR